MQKQGSARLWLTGTLMAGTALAAIGLTTTLPAGAQTNVPAVTVGSFADLVEARSPAVVAVRVESDGGARAAGQLPPEMEEFGRRFGFPQPGGRGPRSGIGSGFFISPDGYLVTNHHVIDGADRITVTLEDGIDLPATLIGSDEKTDLAVLKVAGDDHPHLDFTDSDGVRPGDWVIAIGSPFGLGGTVTAGIVSARGRDLGAGPYDDFLQLDAAINRGNSGGPSLDAQGRVVGVNTAIYSPSGGSVGIGFAVPSNLAERIVADLIEDGRVDRGWLGVSIQPVTDGVAEALGLQQAAGALVADIVDGGPAEAAGVETGDVILRWGDVEIAEIGDLTRAVAETQAGAAVPMTIIREGDERVITADVGALPQEQAATVPARMPMKSPLPGVRLGTLDQERRGELGLSEGAAGLVVDGLEAEAPDGLRTGDVLVEAAGLPITSIADLEGAVALAAEEGRSTLLLRILREGRGLYLTVPSALS